jgi:predicted phosphodiesterase
MPILVVSDLHAGRRGLGENAETREKKAMAAEVIAGYVQSNRAGLSVVLLGDIFHRPDGYAPNVGEGFDRAAATRQIGPLAEVLRATDVPVSYVPGNCDPWAAGTAEQRAELSALLGQRDGRVGFPGFAVSDSRALLTHGHIFNAGLMDTLREWGGFPAPGGAPGHALKDAMERPDDECVRARIASVDAQGGSHHLAFRLKTIVLDGVFALPGLNVVRTALTRSLRKSWDAAYRRSFVAQSATVDLKGAKTIVMGHTHMPGIHEAPSGLRVVNSGSAGADNTEDGNGTVALIAEDGTPSLLWSYHRDISSGRLESVEDGDRKGE